MNKFLYLLLLLALPLGVQAQNYGLNLLGTLEYNEDVSDIWGYVSTSGREYAIMGLYSGTVIISLEDPSNPTEVAYIEGGGSTWRDMKSWGDYAYVSTEAADGILIINMSDADGGNFPYSFYQPQVGNGTLLTIHNIYIDENGYLYVAGSNRNNGGVLIFDLNASPTEPPLVGICENLYSHDVYVRNDTIWSSNLTSGFSAIDVSDKATPITLAYQSTTSNFTHNAWLSDSGQFIFTTDETGNANTDAYDVSDVTNIQRLDTWHPAATEGTGVVPHNAHVLDDFVIISHYTDGVKVVDGNRPTNLVEVGSYDTYPNLGGGTNGCWGAYPFLPSGLLLVSDIHSGLYVFQPTYQRACYLEGNVTDINTGLPLNAVSVVIDAGQINSAVSAASGDYATGQATAGTFDVTYSKLGYVSQTVSVELVNGEVTVQDVELIPLTTTSAGGQVVTLSGGMPVADAVVRMRGQDVSYETTTNASGEFFLNEIFQGDYEIYAGKWGHSTELVSVTVLEGQANIVTVELEEGYEDPFAVDLGWTEWGDAARGEWELGEPVGTSFDGQQFNPDEDSPLDIGDWCYVTGNGGGSAGEDDVDNGSTRITSPSFNLTGYQDPYISYQTWFANDGGDGNPNDELTIRLDNGTDEVIIGIISTSDSQWQPVTQFRVSDFLTPTVAMNISFETSDSQGSGHLVEAGVDNFRVYDDTSSPTSDLEDTALTLDVSPNPFSGHFQILLPEGAGAGQVFVFDITGKEMAQLQGTGGESLAINSQAWPAGVYQVSFIYDNKRIIRKVVKE